MKPIRYTRHARHRMRWRRISESEIESAMLDPDFVEPFLGTRLNAWKKISEKYLRVTYFEAEEETVVLTAVKREKGWR
jgi:hypothetical protein